MDSNYTTPIVVQGTPVASPENHYSKLSYNNPVSEPGGFDNEPTTINFNNEGQAQQQQPEQFRDVVWAVAFVVHLVAMLVVISMNISNGEDAAAGSFSGIYVLVAIAAVVSIGFSSASIALMMRYPTEMIKLGLVTSAVLMGVMALSFILSGSLFAGIIGLLFFFITLYYVKLVWSRVAFAAGESFLDVYLEFLDAYCCCYCYC